MVAWLKIAKMVSIDLNLLVYIVYPPETTCYESVTFRMLFSRKRPANSGLSAPAARFGKSRASSRESFVFVLCWPG